MEGVEVGQPEGVQTEAPAGTQPVEPAMQPACVKSGWVDRYVG